MQEVVRKQQLAKTGQQPNVLVHHGQTIVRQSEKLKALHATHAGWYLLDLATLGKQSHQISQRENNRQLLQSCPGHIQVVQLQQRNRARQATLKKQKKTKLVKLTRENVRKLPSSHCCRAASLAAQTFGPDQRARQSAYCSKAKAPVGAKGRICLPVSPKWHSERDCSSADFAASQTPPAMTQDDFGSKSES